MTRSITHRGQKLCVVTPLLVTKSVLNPSSKQDLFSKSDSGAFEVLKDKFMPYVKLGAVLGTDNSYKIGGEISGCIEN